MKTHTEPVFKKGNIVTTGCLNINRERQVLKCCKIRRLLAEEKFSKLVSKGLAKKQEDNPPIFTVNELGTVIISRLITYDLYVRSEANGLRTISCPDKTSKSFAWVGSNHGFVLADSLILYT